MASADKDNLNADLSAYLDGELTPQRAREVERHLAESAEARHTLEALRAISAGLADLPRVRAPAALPTSLGHGTGHVPAFQKRPPAGRARALRIVTRISAAAALIIVGVFAGWSMLNRTEPAHRGLAQRETNMTDATAGEDRYSQALAKRVAPRGAEPAGMAGTGVTETMAEDAPAIAMGRAPDAAGDRELVRAKVGRTRGAKGGRGGAALILEEEPASAARDAIAPSTAATLVDNLSPSVRLDGASVIEGIPVTAGYPAASAVPTCNLVIAPRNESEYHASLANVALWQRASPVVAGQTVGAEPAAGTPSAGRIVRGTPVAAPREAVLAARQDFTLDIPADQFKEVLDSFELQAPRQVQVVMNFSARDLEQVRQMVNPTGAVATEEAAERFAGVGRGPAGGLEAAEKADTPEVAAAPPAAEPQPDETERLAAGHRGRGAPVVEPPAEPGEQAAAARKEIAPPERVLAHRRRETLDAATMGHLQSLGYLGDSVETDADGDGALEEKRPAPVVRAPSFELQEPDDPRRPRVEEVAAGVPIASKTPRMQSRLAAAESGPGDHEDLAAPPPSFGAALREPVEAVQARVGEMYEIMVGGAFNKTETRWIVEGERAATGPTVTVQITLLPPSSSAHAPAETPPATQPGE